VASTSPFDSSDLDLDAWSSPPPPHPDALAFRKCGWGRAYAGAWLATAAHVAAVRWVPPGGLGGTKMEWASFWAFAGMAVLKPEPPTFFWVDHVSQVWSPS
jgi:hypothetical protein